MTISRSAARAASASVARATAVTGATGNGLPQGAGLLGTTAPLGADVSLVLTVLAAVLLTIGWRLAVRRRYEAHRWVQTARWP